MKRIMPALASAWLFLILPSIAAEPPDATTPPFLGEKVWTSPGWINIRATAYPTGGKCASGVKARYASAHAVGTASVPSWIPRGSLIQIWTTQGSRVYLAVDRGTAVESAKAARSARGAHGSDKAKVVIDFCAPRQLWPDEAKVELYQYVGSVPFDKLTAWQREKLMSYAARYISQS
jgi:hypothetical protein